jgi:ADP-ribosylglycohydrolase
MPAGNGGAMRIAPLAFVLDSLDKRVLIRDAVRITHANDEAYLGTRRSACNSSCAAVIVL